MEVRSFPPTQASPPGVTDIYVSDVPYPQLGAADGFTSTDWLTVGLVGAGLLGVGILLARTA